MIVQHHGLSFDLRVKQDAPDVLVTVKHIVVVTGPRAAGAVLGCTFEGRYGCSAARGKRKKFSIIGRAF